MKTKIIIGSLFLAALAAGSIQADPDVHDFDITGFKLGMTPEEVEAIALREELTKYDERMLTVRGDIENPFLDAQTWGSRQLGRYRFEYMHPPSEPRVTLIKRAISEPQSNPAEVIHDSLMVKYGEPTGNNEGRRNATYYWYHDGGEDSEQCATALVNTVGSSNCTGVQLKVSMYLLDGETGKIAGLKEAILADFGVIKQNKLDFDEHVTEVLRRIEQERLDRAEAPRL